MTSSGRSSSYPFTASQWQELEHQALIYKYMTLGMPIPSELILPMRRSYLLDSTTSTPTLAFGHQPSMGWGCYQMGFGRKAEDPEPGRCRRTDGKKWRCSKEAYPDSKYCERHMHRGKNRSRKPVEMSLTNTVNNPPTPPSSSSNHTISPPVAHHLLYPYHCPSSSRPPGTIAFQPLQNNTPSYYSSADKEYGQRDNKHVDECSFLSEATRAERGSSWEFRPLGISSLGEPKQSSAFQQGAHSFTVDLSRDGEEKQQHCFVLGADFKLEKPVKEEKEKGATPLRHFLDEVPQKSDRSWMGLDGGQASFSKTQLSISTSMAYYDFPVTSSGYRND